VLLEVGLHYRGAATGAWIGGVLNNFWWNRHWTFGAREGHAGFQAARFFVVSFAAFVVSLGVLTLLVEAGVPKLPAQALAIIAVTPLNFVGNKLWSFAR
jgi:putative flippase GtrA